MLWNALFLPVQHCRVLFSPLRVRPWRPTPYIYSPLKYREIRLLVIEIQESGSDNDPLKLGLMPYSFDGLEDQTPIAYSAISYTWGHPSDKIDIFCDGKAISVPKTLASFLETFRRRNSAMKTHGRLLLWADAVCIDQSNLSEKAVQIPLMAEIYSRASRVCIWLGSDAVGLEGLGETITAAHKLLPEVSEEDASRNRLAAESLGPKAASLLALDWKPLQNLLSHQWFERKWVVQEAALNEDTVYLVGDASYRFEELAVLALKLSTYGAQSLLAGTYNRHVSDRLYNLSMIWMARVYHQRGEITLLDAVKATRKFLCTDAKDHVYGVMALVCDEELKAPARNILTREDMYWEHTTPEEVFKRFAIYQLQVRKDISFLSLAPQKAVRLHMALSWKPWVHWVDWFYACRRNMPSWVPDLRAQEFDVLTSFSMKKRKFCAGRSNTGAGRYEVLEGKILKCRGIVIDTVEAMTDCLGLLPLRPYRRNAPEHLKAFDKTIVRTLERELRWIDQCIELASLGRGMEAMSDNRFQEFTNTLICERLQLSDRIDPGVNLSGNMKSFIQSLRSFLTIHDLDRDEGVRVREEIGRVAYILESSMATNVARCFILTEDGRLGMAPRETRKEDSVVIFPGCEVPLILRKSKRKTYTLIGDCYISGVMDGEVFDCKHEFTDILLE
jgi:hypothetical protein